MPCARLFLATCVALACSGASSAVDMDVGNFLSRCSALKPVLTGEKDTDSAGQKNLSWCTSNLSDILEDYRVGVLKRNQLPKIRICLPEGTTDAELLLIVLDELQTQDKSAKVAKVITDTLSVWWPCK